MSGVSGWLLLALAVVASFCNVGAQARHTRPQRTLTNTAPGSKCWVAWQESDGMFCEPEADWNKRRSAMQQAYAANLNATAYKTGQQQRETSTPISNALETNWAPEIR